MSRPPIARAPFLVAALVPEAKQAGASLIIVNAQPTPFDAIADVTLSGSISEVLPELFGATCQRSAAGAPCFDPG